MVLNCWWCETFSSTFQEYILTGHYNHSTPVDAKIMESKNWSIINEHVGVNCAT